MFNRNGDHLDRVSGWWLVTSGGGKLCRSASNSWRPWKKVGFPPADKLWLAEPRPSVRGVRAGGG